MPRPTKAIRRQKTTAAELYKKGERKEAYEMWAKAATALKEHQQKKRNKNKPASTGEAAAS